MIDVENAWEIHHFVQNGRESRQWILRSVLNDEEKKPEISFERVLGVDNEINLEKIKNIL